MALFFIGLFIGLVFAGPLRSFFGLSEASLRRLFRSGSANPAAADAPLADNVPAALEPAEEPLAIKLRKLETQFLPIVESAAHPRELQDQPSFQEAAALFRSDAVPMKTVMQYVLGANWALSCVALSGLAARVDRESVRDQVVSAFDRLTPWAMHYALAYFLGCLTRPPVGAPYVNAKEWWKDNPFIQLDAQEYFDEAEQLGDAAGFGGSIDALLPENYPFIRGMLERVNNNLARQLILELDARQRGIIDRTFLSSFGRFWGQGEKLDLLVEPGAWRDMLANAEAAVKAEPARSLLASGEPRIGKTSFLRLLARRLEREGWTVFEAGGADLMAGQQWFGQLEGRIQKAVEELSASKKLIWYIPDILQIALSGTHQGQAASILEQILPAISAGRLIVWTEASPAGSMRLLRLRPQLRNIFEVIRFEPLSKEDTLALAHSVTARLSHEAGLEIDPACAHTALTSARQYLSSTGFPGSVLDLLKSAIARAMKGTNRTVTPHDVIASLSQATGVPAAILDSKERADLASIRKYFSARVMGQDEAAFTMVDRIAMLKAGLNDPGKPIGVFLFAGPTGTGKTELAKTLAEFLFGSPDRLIRLDMSEYQAPLAATIVERRFPEGDQFVFVRSDGKAIQAEFVDPDSGAGQGPEAAAPLSGGDKSAALPAMILAARGDAAELKSLEHHFETIQAAFTSDAWDQMKDELAARMQVPDFWAKPERYEVLAHFALMDRVRAASETAESLRARLVKAGDGAKSSKELVARLALQLHLIGEGIKDVLEAAPIEAVLSVEPALEGGGDRHGDPDGWCEQLLAMYRAWASSRNMQLSEVSGKAKVPPLLVIGGFGAYRTLSHEAGLHVLEMPAEERTVDRVTARVRLAPAPLGEVPPNRLNAALAAALSRAAPSNTLIRRYRNGTSPLVRDLAGNWRTGRFDAVLRGDFDLIGAVPH